MNLPLTRSLSNSSRGNLRSPNAGDNILLPSSTTMRQNLKLLSVAILCFIGGMQFDSGSVVQVNFSSHEASHEIAPSSSIGNPGTVDAPPPAIAAAQSKFSDHAILSASNKGAGGNTQAVARSAEATTTAVTKKQPPPQQTDTPIERIVLLGERHSGTNWITDHLDECFGDRVIVSIPFCCMLSLLLCNSYIYISPFSIHHLYPQVNNEYTRYKHWFQEDTISPPDSAIVVAMFRDPIDWVDAMRWEPHHAHDHLHFKPNYTREVGRVIVQEKEATNASDNHLYKATNASDGNNNNMEDEPWWWEVADRMQWKEFVTTPWFGRRGKKDNEVVQVKGGEDAICMDYYRYVDAAPCSVEDAPMLRGLGEYKYEYKHDGSEIGFSSILDLRRDKILNHLGVANYKGCRALLPYRFEFLKANGTESLLRDIEEASGLRAQCKPIYGRIVDLDGEEKDARLETTTTTKSSEQRPSIRQRQRRQLAPKILTKKRVLPNEYIRYMNRFVDWEVESLIGYSPRAIIEV